MAAMDLTLDEAAKLLAAGCDSLQGFLFSPPIPVDAFEKKYGA
ncbi:hypothetical protein [Selenomonas sp.]|nr:hypothetical protein [Selenomonas sp.]